MSRLNRRIQTFLLGLVLFGAAVAPAYAQAPSPTPAPPVNAPRTLSDKTPATLPPMPSKQPYGFAAAPPDGYDIMTNPVIAGSLKEGGKAYYIGNRAGLDGWLLMQGNEVEIVYLAADRKTMMIGTMFASEGYNITADQIRVLFKNNPVVAAGMSEITKEQLGVVDPNTTQSNGMPRLPTPRDMSREHAGEPNASTQVAQLIDMAQHTSAPGAKTAPLIPTGERFLLDLQDANGVDVGGAQAPLLYMVMDPNCPHCQATWRMLRDAVFSRTIRVRLVPVGMNDEDERASAQLLRAKDPLDVWDKYVAGDKSQLAGAADPKLIDEVRSNHAMVDSWSINQTPYMAYRSAKSGDMKVVAGEPAHADSLVADVGQ